MEVHTGAVFSARAEILIITNGKGDKIMGTVAAIILGMLIYVSAVYLIYCVIGFIIGFLEGLMDKKMPYFSSKKGRIILTIFVIMIVGLINGLSHADQRNNKRNDLVCFGKLVEVISPESNPFITHKELGQKICVYCCGEGAKNMTLVIPINRHGICSENMTIWLQDNHECSNYKYKKED
jgi:hypothetical protein